MLVVDVEVEVVLVEEDVEDVVVDVLVDVVVVVVDEVEVLVEVLSMKFAVNVPAPVVPACTVCDEVEFIVTLTVWLQLEKMKFFGGVANAV